MSSHYLELLLELRPDANRGRMRSGAPTFRPAADENGLVVGDLDVPAEFSPPSGTETGDVAVPDDWRSDVQNIRIFKPRSLHDS